MRQFPAFLDLSDRSSLAVGDGERAARKLRLLLKAGARVTVVAPHATAATAALAAAVARARRTWGSFFADPPAGALAGLESAGADRRRRPQRLSLIKGGKTAASGAGIVHIVGAGPGDPELLSLKALRLLREADVVIYDKLVGPEILDYARRDAERLYVGKAKADHSKSQDEINWLMAAQARQGKRVVRLKGGDPYVFGRGGEERAFLEAQGVPVTVVPGITAAVGCAAAAGIPLISRGTAQAVTFLTGHAQSGGEPDLDWRQLAHLNQTLAIYMGVSTAGVIARRLIENGLSPTTPAAIVENGTLASQKTVTGRLCELESLVAEAGIAGPALIIVGEVVRLGSLATDSLPHAIAV